MKRGVNFSLKKPLSVICFLSLIRTLSSITPENPVAPQEKFTIDACRGGDEHHTSSFQRKFVRSCVKTTNMKRGRYCFSFTFSNWSNSAIK